MAEDIVKDENIVTDEEYERALEMLNSSKSSRVKKIRVNKKPAKEKKDDGKAFDPVIPLCLIMAAVVFIGALLYFILPVATNPSMDMTYDEFTTRFESLDMYKSVFSQFDINIKDVSYITKDSETGKEIAFKVTDNNFYLDSFEKLVSPSLGAAVQGQSRKFDNKLTFLRAIVEYDSSVNNYSFMTAYFGAFLAAIYPDMSEADCCNMATAVLEKYDGSGNYTVYGDYAFRVLYGSDEGNSIGYMALEIVPAKNI